MERIKHEPNNEEAWICICGNEPHQDGFYPCDANGNEIEPDSQSGWDGLLYVCHKCKRIINQNTLEVIGRAQ